jgi:hypothetical protein
MSVYKDGGKNVVQHVLVYSNLDAICRTDC